MTNNAGSVSSFRYDKTTIFLHWTVAGLVILLWCLGQTIDWFPPKLPRIFARSSHIVIGFALTFVIGWRIVWRLRRSRFFAQPSDPGFVAAVAKAGHFLLYASVAATVVLGIANAWVRGDNIFNLFSIPAFDPGNRALRSTIEDWHSWAANILLALAGLHAAAALFHRYVLHDTVLQRMLPNREQTRA